MENLGDERMICPYPDCGLETSIKWFAEGVGQCEHCNRIIEYKEPKKSIIVPGLGKHISEFAQEVADELKGKNTLFYRVDTKDIVEIATIKAKDNEEEKYLGFVSITPSRFITILEKYVAPGAMIKDVTNGGWVFKNKSINAELAKTILASDILQKALPQITRIFTIPIPILYEGKLTFPKKGYDERFCSWLPYDAPNITKPDMSLEEAKETFKQIFKGFCFETQQDYYNAVAALLTPYLRGLYPRFNIRTPVWFYLANRERAGKDYLAGITGLVYEGHNLEESPICNAEKHGGSNSEELRKKIFTAMISGRKRMHFSNNKGYIDNAAFESITTAEKYTDRILGKNENADFDNEIEFSLSGNSGITFTPDFANRCRFIRLFLDIEDANQRTFDIPDLHGYILENREQILSAIYALIRNWREKGSVPGTKPFASFHNWAITCGGVMEAAGYGNPCEVDKNIACVAGDAETQDMKALFEEAFECYPNREIEREAMLLLIKQKGLFDGMDLENRREDQTKFWLSMKKYVGRVMSGIRMVVTNPLARPARFKYMFTKEVVNREKIVF